MILVTIHRSKNNNKKRSENNLNRLNKALKFVVLIILFERQLISFYNLISFQNVN